MQGTDRAHNNDPVFVIGLDGVAVFERFEVGQDQRTQSFVRPMESSVGSGLRPADCQQSVYRRLEAAVKRGSRHRRINVGTRLVAAVQKCQDVGAVRGLNSGELPGFRAAAGVNPGNTLMAVKIDNSVSAEPSGALLKARLDDSIERIRDLLRRLRRSIGAAAEGREGKGQQHGREASGNRERNKSKAA